MRDEEIGELFNKAISKMAPEAVDMLWPDVKKPVEEQIKNVSFYYFLRPLKHPLATDVMIKVMQGWTFFRRIEIKLRVDGFPSK
jgi:hypothetical protein